jgi:hypothetical protein
MTKPIHNNKDYSDSRLKTNFAAISTPLAKVQALHGLCRTPILSLINK